MENQSNYESLSQTPPEKLLEANLQKTLRDELAMNLDFSAFPMISSGRQEKEVSEWLNIPYSEERSLYDIPERMEWLIIFQAAIRYRYADKMIEARERNKL